ncbi:hypothetical protein CRP01_06270 [Flavilitoribacter nigricans DSM 23189 = NBRC 102662]|uniref:Uncharacterized protein n=2 Tax=Flavilitoribacter TaxID=2762562 RepID=A0A2D0NGT1_FLAN2|nr:hypothetical protein CRP01_06270 [Flavilitoribacter nigricans DSM 23189 = NBRC 102662]
MIGLALLLCLGCQKERDLPLEDLTDFACPNDQLPLVSDPGECSAAGHLLVCNVYELAETKFLEAEDYAWVPMLCKDPAASVSYLNAAGESAELEITSRAHYIYRSRSTFNCSASTEHVDIVCQQNETAHLEFLGTQFGPDTLHLELSYFVNEITNEAPADPILRIILFQSRNLSNIANFYHSVDAMAENYSTRKRTYHNSITLLGTEYGEVIEFKVSETYNGAPYLHFYLKKGFGILAYKLHGELWVQSRE